MPPDTPSASRRKTSKKIALPSTIPTGNPPGDFPVDSPGQQGLKPPPDGSMKSAQYLLENSMATSQEPNFSFPDANGQDHALNPPHSHKRWGAGFEALINLDGGADLFAAEYGLGLDMDTNRMAGLTGGRETEGEMNTGVVDGVHGYEHEHDGDYEMHNDEEEEEEEEKHIQHEGITVDVEEDEDIESKWLP